MTPDDPRHGTEAGCREHYRQGQKPCAPCLNAHRIKNNLRELYPHKTNAIGSQRRIQALQALGYGRGRIARELGYGDGGALSYLMNADTLLVGTAARIREVYDRLSMTIPQGAGPSRARTWARRNGYAPPLAWDNIDDPREQPKGTRLKDDGGVDPVVVDRILGGEWRLRCNRAERDEVIRTWQSHGKSLTELDRLTGWNVQRDLRRMREDVA